MKGCGAICWGVCVLHTHTATGSPGLPAPARLPAHPHPYWPRSALCRYPWLAARREPWSTTRHSDWPPKFQAAAQCLLMVHRWGRTVAAGPGPGPERAVPLTRAAKRARLEGATAPRLQMRQRRRTDCSAVAAIVGAGAGASPSSSTADAACSRPAAGGGRKRQRGLLPAAAGEGLEAEEVGWGAADADAAVRPAIAALPRELLLRVLEQAAYPVSCWL